MAPLLPAPEMESNDRSPGSRWRGGSLPVSRRPRFRSGCRRRLVSNQARKRASAAPSRIWALRMPSISSGFLQALGNWQGSALADLRRRPCAAGRRWPRPRWRDRPARSCLSARPARRRIRPGHAAARALPRCAINSGLRLASSRNRSAPPSSCRMAKARAKGVCGTSCRGC